jgi:hypothetical protein
VEVISVICTGVGVHREVAMRRFNLGHSLTGRPWKKYDGWCEIADHHAAPLKDSYTFTCRRCGRKTRMKGATLRKALDGLHAAGWPTLDISELPF